MGKDEWRFAVDQWQGCCGGQLCRFITIYLHLNCYIFLTMNQLKTTNKLLILALVLGLAFHGSLLFYTLESTYDALIHLFFADHYARDWFSSWDTRWYTGFTVHGYPPLVHQSIALLSMIGGLKFGMFAVGFIGIILFVTGVYRFTRLLVAREEVAGLAAVLAVFSSAFIETLHLFGQLPSIVALSLLMHSLPYIYSWITLGRRRDLYAALTLIGVMVTSHHVTPIFGMVFFIFPLIGMAIMDRSKDDASSWKGITLRVFYKNFRKLFWRIVYFGGGSLVFIVGGILPYWINTKNNPITQVPIPHGSRDSFLEVTSSGLVFFLIPWGVFLLALPFLFYRFYSKRYLFFGLSFSLLTLLGTGGTTPIPKMILGDNAFNILTLDRFTLWASMMALPVFAEFMYRLVMGDIKTYLSTRFGSMYHRIIAGVVSGALIFMAIFSLSLGYFRPSQPQKIKMLPIVNFLQADQHDHWRYLTLGFGDQMAWLSAQTTAMTVDGNYHSARRLPELTTRAVERLENSKYRGIEGVGSLQQFLTTPEKYNLKFIFSNDKFYDPLLFFTGWQRLQQLENGIVVWEKLDVPPLPTTLYRPEENKILNLLWGLIPIGTVILAFMVILQWGWVRYLRGNTTEVPEYLKYGASPASFRPWVGRINHLWGYLILLIVAVSCYQLYLKNDAHHSPENLLLAYYDALDFKEFERAHSYLDPESGKSLDQFLLEISVSDGLLSSYAKLDSLSTNVVSDSAGTNAAVHSLWITPLERIAEDFSHQLVQRDGKWYIIPDYPDPDIPPDQLILTHTLDYYNHGRRKISTQQTYHEDVLRQPELEILSASLIEKPDGYYVTGWIHNVDSYPADYALSAMLLNGKDEPLAGYNAKHTIKHKIWPGEMSPFMVAFEAIAWTDETETKPTTYNPEEFTPVELSDIPVNFQVSYEANLATQDLYQEVSLRIEAVNAEGFEGILFNGGIQEVTVSQLLVSYFDEDKQLLWVDHKFIKNSVRVQRKTSFSYNFRELSQTRRLLYKERPGNQKNRQIVAEPESYINRNLIPVEAENYKYITVDLVHYVGAPR
jgi:hypothetical protein